MADILKVKCYKCGTVYELTPEFAGEIGECAACDAVFVIPAHLEGKEDEIIETYPYLAQMDAKTEENKVEDATATADVEPEAIPAATNTVKLSRNTIGMLPEVNDTFKVTKVNYPSHRSSVESKTTETDAGAALKAKKKPWWRRLIFWK